MIFTETTHDGRTAVIQQEPGSVIRSQLFTDDDPATAAAFAAVLDDPLATLFVAREGFLDSVIRGFREQGITSYATKLPGC